MSSSCGPSRVLLLACVLSLSMILHPSAVAVAEDGVVPLLLVDDDACVSGVSGGAQECALHALQTQSAPKKMTALAARDDTVAHSASKVQAMHFRAGPGVMLGKYRLVERLESEPVHQPPALVLMARDRTPAKWPAEFEAAFGGKYGEGELLGRGGQGEVWKATDPATGQFVAVKIYIDHPDGYLTWESADVEEREALQQASHACDLMMTLSDHAAEDPVGSSRILKCLANNIVSTEDPPLPSHIVLEFGGPDLTHWIQDRNGTLGDPEEARKWIAQTAQALRYMQAQDPPLLHHDLKPDNTMLVEGSNGESSLKLFDFGCAVEGTTEGQQATVAYTLAYAPPEIANSRCRDPDDPQTVFNMPTWSFDVYSLGMMYWEMLCPNISMKNGNSMVVFDFLCMPPPLGDGDGYNAGTLRRYFDEKTPDGNPKCPSISDAEVDLIESMLGPHGQRPSPSKILQFPLLAAYDS